MRKGVLILGSYGNFGKYIAHTLLSQNIPVILSGRNPDSLRRLQTTLQKQYPEAQIPTSIIDVNQIQASDLTGISPKVVINTCGPFQTANYRVVEKCIESSINYIDLADGRQFVTGMNKYNQSAMAKNVTIITGASSVPGLSSAVLEQFQSLFSSIQKLEYGISPGQRTNRGGQATVKGVMGYIGKPIAPFGNLTRPIYGWQNIYAQQYPELGYRLMGNCEVPDLDIFPQKYNIKDLKFSAGTQSKFLHTGIWFISWLIRLGVPINLPKYSSFLHKASHTLFDFLGTDQGGMHMKIYGISKEDKKILVKWFIIVRKGHGPNVPVIPAIILAKKIIQQEYSLPGVHACVGLVSLNQYLEGLKDFDYSTHSEIEQITQN